MRDPTNPVAVDRSPLAAFQPASGTWADHARGEGPGGAFDPCDEHGGEHEWIDAVHRTVVRDTLPLGRAVAVVDFGCGSGRFCRELAPEVGRVFGVDLTPEMLDLARGIGLPDNVELLQTDGIEIPLRTASVDAVVSVHVLRYAVFDAGLIRRILASFARVLRPGGVCVCIEPAGDAVLGARRVGEYERFAGAVGLECVERVPIRCGSPSFWVRSLALCSVLSDRIRTSIIREHVRRTMRRSPDELAGDPPVDWLVVLRRTE